MKFTDLIPVVSKVAPALGTALAGPAGGIVGSLLAQIFGASHDDPQELLNRIQSDPEAEYKIKSLQVQLQQLDMQTYQTEVDDRKDARKRQVELKDHTPEVLAAAFVIIYAVIQYIAIQNPSGQDDVISARVQDIMLMIISFYFGSMHKRRKPN